MEEQGFVFNTEDEKTQTELNPEINSVMNIDSNKLIEELTGHYYLFGAKITLKEDENPEEFNKVFAASVERERDKVKRKKIRRAETRAKLERGLFGKKD